MYEKTFPPTICILVLFLTLSSVLGFVGNLSGVAVAAVMETAAEPDPTPPALISPRCSNYAAPAVPAPSRTFYVNATDGNDSNDGASPESAWKTLARANGAASPGDLFLLRGTFRDQWISPARSGTETSKIVYKREPGAVAVLDRGLYGGAVDLIERSHIVIDGIEIINTEQSVRIAYGSHHNWLRNLYIHDAPSTAVKFRYGAHFNRLEDSVITRIGTSTDNEADAINLLDDADNNVIVRNFVGYASHAAYNDDVQGGSTGKNENNIVAQNIFDNPWASNVILAGRSDSTIVECNIMRNATRTSQVNYPRMGLQLDGDNNIIRFNFIYNNSNQGILIEGRVFASTQQMFAENNHIYHNTITGNGSAGIVLATQGQNSYIRNNLIENNLLWANGGFDGANGFLYDLAVDNYNGGVHWSANNSDGNVFRSNNISKGGAIRFLIIVGPAGSSNLELNTVNAAGTAFPAWTGNTNSDPMFMAPESFDYSLKSGSSMIDTGRMIAGVTYHGSAPDRGAVEWTGAEETFIGLEGDVASGPTGDGALTNSDIEMVRQFAVGNLQPNHFNNEFQRADSAPIATKGDGLITASDIVQTKRFVAGLDTPGPAGGTSKP